MPRTARGWSDGGTYHVLTRGNNRQPVFHIPADFQRYLHRLVEVANDHQLTVLHFALMPNHVHLVIRVVEGPRLSRAMLSLNLAYALYYRNRYHYAGHLWQGRFKCLPIETDAHLLACGRYIELNPVRAGLADAPHSYLWTSYRAYAEGLAVPPVISTAHPGYLTLGSTPQERQVAYRQLVREELTRRDAPCAPWHHSHGICRQHVKPPRPAFMHAASREVSP